MILKVIVTIFLFENIQLASSHNLDFDSNISFFIISLTVLLYLLSKLLLVISIKGGEYKV